MRVKLGDDPQADERKTPPPETFISYAWGVPEQERWVEKRLAADLQKAGIEIVLDRWHNVQIGASVARFVERIEKSDRIIMVGTPRRKYENKDTSTGYVVAAEVDLINNRLLGTEAQKQSVLPVRRRIRCPLCCMAVSMRISANLRTLQPLSI